MQNFKTLGVPLKNFYKEAKESVLPLEVIMALLELDLNGELALYIAQYTQQLVEVPSPLCLKDFDWHWLNLVYQKSH